MPIPLGIFATAGAGAVARNGYFAGGSIVGGIAQATIDKFSLPSDARTTLGTGLAVATEKGPGFANSGVAGYMAGGNTGSGTTNIIRKTTFATDAQSTAASNLSVLLVNAGGMANSGVAGYVGGGFDATNGNNYTSIEKLSFPAESRSILSGTLSGGGQGWCGWANSGVAGYLAHNFNVNKISFPSDTVSSVSGGMGVQRAYAGAMANSGTAGYVASGAPAYATSINKFTFPTDTRSTLGATVSAGREGLSGMANSGTAGYWGGGFAYSPDRTFTTVDKLTFASDTTSTLGTGLSLSRAYTGAFANSGTL
jgi:hypothetical protein